MASVATARVGTLILLVTRAFQSHFTVPGGNVRNSLGHFYIFDARTWHCCIDGFLRSGVLWVNHEPNMFFFCAFRSKSQRRPKMVILTNCPLYARSLGDRCENLRHLFGGDKVRQNFPIWNCSFGIVIRRWRRPFLYHEASPQGPSTQSVCTSLHGKDSPTPPRRGCAIRSL